MRRLAAAALVVLVAVAGCGGDDDSPDGGITIDVPISTDTDGGGGSGSENLTVDIPAELPDAVVTAFGVTEPSAPVSAGGRVVYVEGGSLLVSVDPTSRDVVSRDLASAEIVGVLDDAVVVHDGATVSVLDGTTLETRVELPAPEGVGGLVTAAVDPAGRYIVTGYAQGYASFSATDGTLLFSGPMQPVRRVFVRDDTAAAMVSLDGDVWGAFTFDPATGTPTGDVVLGDRTSHELVGVVGTNRILVTEDGDFRDDPPGGWIYAIDTTSRAELWRVEADSYFDEPLVLDSVIAAPNQDDTIRRIDVATGEAASAPTGSRVEHAPVVHDGSVVMVNADAEVLVLDATTGEPLADPLVLPDVDDIHGWALAGDVLYVTGTQSLLNVDDDPSTLYGIDLTVLVDRG